MADLYLIILQGQGDTEVKVVDKETWDWIGKDPTFPAGQSGMDDPEVPPSQLAKRKPDRYDGTLPTFHITRGSWDNDRALQCYPADGYEELGYGSSVREAFAAVAAKGDKIVDEYHGCIY